MHDQPVTQPPANFASRDRRLGAALLDGLFMIMLLIPVLYFTGEHKELLEVIRSGKPVHQSLGQQIIGLLMGLAAYLLLNGYLLYKKGQTLGKMILKTRVVDLQGNRPSFDRLVFIRYLIPNVVGSIPVVGSWLLVVNFLFIFRSDHRCLHDYLAGTRVVNV